MSACLSADSCSNAVGFMRCAPRAHNSHNIARREPESCMRLRFAGYMACARDVITTATFSVSCVLLCSSTRNSSGVLNVSVLIATQFHKVRSGFLGTHCVMQAASAATAATAASWRITAHNGAQLLGSANNYRKLQVLAFHSGMGCQELLLLQRENQLASIGFAPWKR